jgi:hypothetical protein
MSEKRTVAAIEQSVKAFKALDTIFILMADLHPTLTRCQLFDQYLAWYTTHHEKKDVIGPVRDKLVKSFASVLSLLSEVSCKISTEKTTPTLLNECHRLVVERIHNEAQANGLTDRSFSEQYEDWLGMVE